MVAYRQHLLITIRAHFPAAQHALPEDIIIHTSLPRYPTWKIEVAEEAWETAFADAHDVEIVIRSRNPMG